MPVRHAPEGLVEGGQFIPEVGFSGHALARALKKLLFAGDKPQPKPRMAAPKVSGRGSVVSVRRGAASKLSLGPAGRKMAGVGPAKKATPRPAAKKTSGSVQADVFTRRRELISQGSRGGLGRGSNKAAESVGRMQGFDRPPRTGTKAMLDREVAGGGVEVWHGADTPKVAALRSGQFGYGGGFYGSGYYTSTGHGVAEFYAGAHGDDKPSSGSVVRMVLRPNARVGDHDQLDAQYKAFSREHPDLARAIDPGGFAAMLGYDAVKVDGTKHGHGAGGMPKADQYIVLNRGALLVDRQDEHYTAGESLSDDDFERMIRRWSPADQQKARDARAASKAVKAAPAKKAPARKASAASPRSATKATTHEGALVGKRIHIESGDREGSFGTVLSVWGADLHAAFEVETDGGARVELRPGQFTLVKSGRASAASPTKKARQFDPDSGDGRLEEALSGKSPRELRKIAYESNIDLPATARTKPAMILHLIQSARDHDHRSGQGGDRTRRRVAEIAGRITIRPAGPPNIKETAAHVQQVTSSSEVIHAIDGPQWSAAKLRELADELGIDVPPRLSRKTDLQLYLGTEIPGHRPSAAASPVGAGPAAKIAKVPGGVAKKIAPTARHPAIRADGSANAVRVRQDLLDLSSDEERFAYLKSLGLNKTKTNQLAKDLGAQQTGMDPDSGLRNIVRYFSGSRGRTSGAGSPDTVMVWDENTGRMREVPRAEADLAGVAKKTATKALGPPVAGAPLAGRSIDDLRAIASAEGIAIPPGLNAAEIRKLISARRRSAGAAAKIAGGSPAVAKVARAGKAAPRAGVDTKAWAAHVGGLRQEHEIVMALDSEPDMSAPRLREVARDLGIDVPAGLRTKADLQLHIAQQVARRGGGPSVPRPGLVGKTPFDAAAQARRIVTLAGGRQAPSEHAVLGALEGNNVTQLRALARVLGIEIPANVSGAAAIRRHIAHRVERDFGRFTWR